MQRASRRCPPRWARPSRRFRLTQVSQQAGLRGLAARGAAAPRHGHESLPRLRRRLPARPPTRAGRAEFRAALADAFGGDALLRAFLAVRASEWEHFRDVPAEQEAALLYGRY